MKLVLSVVLFFFVGLAWQSEVVGQGFLGPARTVSGRFIEAPRSIQQQLREAERALAEERYSDAVVRLGDLLASEGNNEEDELAGQDFFLEIDDTRPQGTPVNSSMMRTARMMIGLLPSDALETYQLRYGPSARRILNEAAQARDWHLVSEVRRKYFHTEAGYEASVLLAQQEMLAGNALAASLLLDDLVSVPRAVGQLGQGVVLLHAAASQLSGRKVASATSANTTVLVSGEEQSVPATTELPAWIAEQVARVPDYSSAEPADYPMLGGSPDRNGFSAGQFPLTNVRWKLDTTASPRQKRAVRQSGDELATSGKLPPPCWMPLRVGDQLLMRTTERLVGVDYRTGKRVWTYPWQAAYDAFPDEEASLDSFGTETDPSDLLNQRVWNDMPYGQITSDGQRVFMLDDLAEVEAAAYSSTINLGGTRPSDTRVNTLVALDLATEGKLQWRLGAGADDDPTFSEAFFLGPPLPLNGRLYVMVEIAGDIILSCLHPATGQELWRQQLIAVESGGIDADPIRRVAGAMPTYHQGLLICPTGAGATVTIDLVDRMLRWGVSYDRNDAMNRSISGGRRGRGLEADQLMQRWHSGIAVSSNRSVLVTPIEADRLFGFDVITGETLFPQKNRVSFRYLAGIRGDAFIVVGTDKVRAFRLSDGAMLWSTKGDLLSAGQQVSGRGVFAKDEYLVPTTANQIIRISLADGKVVDRRNTRYALGNLVAAGGEIIAQGPSEIAVAYGETSLEPMVDRLLAKDPNDFEALVRKSELLIQRGDRDEALGKLTRAREMEPDNDEVRMLSVAAMLGTLRENLSVDDNLIETLDQLIDQPSQRVELLSLRVRAALSEQDYVGAAARLVDLSTLINSESMLETSSAEVINDNSRYCTLDGWLSARSNEIASLASEGDLDRINDMLTAMVDSDVERATGRMIRLVKHFGVFDGVSGLRSQLLQQFQGEGSYLQLERQALGTLAPSADAFQSLSSERLEALANAYALGGMPQDAIAVIDALGPQKAAGAAVGQIRQLALGKLRQPDWNEHVALTWSPRTQTRIRTFTARQRVAETTVMSGRSFAGWRLISDAASPLGFRDPTGLVKRISLEGTGQIDDSDKEAFVSGGVMLVMMPSGLICVDLYHLLAGDGEAVLWRRGLGGESSPMAKRGVSTTPFDDQIYYYSIAQSGVSNPIPEFKVGPILGDRLLVLQGGDLIAIDLFTNETLWRNSTAPRTGSVLCDGERVAVVSSDTDEVVYFDVMDGRKLETKKWGHGRIWEAMEEHVVSYLQQQDREYEVRMVNPFSGEVALSRQCASANRTTKKVPATYGRVVSGRYVVLLDSDGKAAIWDIKVGKEIGKPTLPAYPDLQGLHVTLLEDQLVLLPKRRTDRSKQPQGQQLQTTDGAFHRTVDGVHAVSLSDGSLQWGQQFSKSWGCTLTQPSGTPMLVLTRSPFTYAIQSRKKFLDVLALDVRDGNVLNEHLGKPIQSQNNELEVKLTVQPVLSRVITQIGGEILTYTFTDDPAPESPTEEQ